jgi:hypothetical protein
MEHLEKDIKKMWHHKDVIILVLVIALVVVSGIAICLGINSEEHDGRGGDYGRMERGAYMDDNNQNLNDGEYADDASSTNATTSMPTKIMNEVKETIGK